MELFTTVFGNIIYGALALVAIWGFFCIVLVWMRVSQKRFRSEAEQNTFLAELDRPLTDGNFDAAMQVCHDDPRALDAAVRVEDGVREAVRSGVRTRDLGGGASTDEFTAAVVDRISSGR